MSIKSIWKNYLRDPVYGVTLGLVVCVAPMAPYVGLCLDEMWEAPWEKFEKKKD